jgi:hypothetical protein
MTPAMESGITDHIWTIGDFLFALPEKAQTRMATIGPVSKSDTLPPVEEAYGIRGLNKKFGTANQTPIP